MNTDIIKDKFKFKVAISKMKEENNMAMNKRGNFINKKIGIAACACLMLTTGIVFAKDIKRFIFNSYLMGPENTINNGYISKYNGKQSEYTANVTKGNNSKDLKTAINIENFLISNESISMEMVLELEDEIKNFIEIKKTEEGNINYEEFYNVEFSELYVLDEEKNLIYSPYAFNNLENKEEKFNDFCKENNLEFEYGNFNDKYFNSILNNDLWEFSVDDNKLYISLNIGKNIMNSYEKIPSSKNLSIFIKEIKLVPKNIEKRDDTNNTITINGYWNLNLDVPEIMQNREEIKYKVSNIENKNIEVVNAVVTEMKFNLELIISNIEEPIMPEECIKVNEEIMKENNGEMIYPETREGYIELYGSEEIVNEYEKYLMQKWPVSISGENNIPWKSSKSEGCYVVNQNNEKFNSIPAGSLGNYCYNSEYDENEHTVNTFLNKYRVNINFEMTKYDATNKIEVIIDYMGTPTKIILEKI